MDTYQDILGLDIETCSAADIKSTGAWAYSQHPSTSIYCVVFGIARKGRDPWFFRWEPGEELPARLVEFIQAGGRLLAHNVSFERSIWTNILVPRHGFPLVALDQWADTQAMAAAYNLPLALAGLAKALGAEAQKDKEGAALMRVLAQASDDGARPAEATAVAVKRLADYCQRDVETMLACYSRMAPLSITESRVWAVDQKINHRGVLLDLDLAAKCRMVSEQRKKELATETFKLTHGELANSTAAPALKKWLVARGVDLPTVTRKKADGSFHRTPSADRASVEQILADLPTLSLLQGEETARLVDAVLRNRLEANKATSLAKLARVASMVGHDGRLRNALGYCVAHTGRWSSSGFQIHNLPKSRMTPVAQETILAMLQRGSLEGLKLVSDSPLESISQSLRSVLIAPPGRELIGADFSAIEARVIAWLAGQEDILEEFYKGTDVYVYTAEALGSDDRQLGKVCVLALGYGMGALKFVQTANAWGVPIDAKTGITIQRAWRQTNTQIVDFWGALEDGFRQALADPHHVVTVGYLRLFYDGQAVRLRLPSGRDIFYWRPSLRWTTKEFKTLDEHGNVVSIERDVQEIRYFTVAPDKSRMQSEVTYGGKLAENATQAVARDLLGEALVRLDRDPYEVVIHVHDSIAAEVDEGCGNIDEFMELMAHPPTWAAGCPIAVDGYRGVRFRG